MGAVTVNFSLIGCRCGMQRQRGTVCPDCGKEPQPFEVDILAQDRIRKVAGVADVLAAPAEPSAVDVEQLVDGGLYEEFRRFMRAADLVATSGDVEPFLAAAADAAGLRAWAEQHVPLRPTIAVERAAVEATLSVADALASVVSALEAPTVPLVQQRAKDMTRALADFEDAIDRARETMAFIERVAEADDPLAACFMEIFQPDDGIDFAGVAAAGAAILHERTGDSCPDDLAAVVLYFEAVVSAIGVPDTFWELVTAYRAKLADHPEQVRTVVAEPLFAEAVARLTHDSWSRARRVPFLGQLETPREEASEVLRYGHAVIEGTARPLYSAAAAIASGKTYESMAGDDAGVVFQRAHTLGFGLPRPLSGPMRHGYAHMDYTLDGRHITLAAARKKGHAPVVTIEEALDNVLEIEEATDALLLAIQLAALDAGGALPDALKDIPGARLTELWLRGLGWGEVRVEVDGDTAKVVAAPDRAVSAAEVAPALAMLPPHVAALVVVFERGDAPPVRLELDADANRAFSAEPSESRRLALYAVMLRTWLLDGEPFIGSDAAGKVLVATALKAVPDKTVPGAETNRLLVGLAKQASALGIESDAERIRELRRWFLDIATGTGRSYEDVRHVCEQMLRECELPSMVVFDPAPPPAPKPAKGRGQPPRKRKRNRSR